MPVDPRILEVGDDISSIVEEAKEVIGETLHSKEAFAIGLGLFMTGSLGFGMRHPEIGMFVVAEAGDVGKEIASGNRRTHFDGRSRRRLIREKDIRSTYQFMERMSCIIFLRIFVIIGMVEDHRKDSLVEYSDEYPNLFFELV